MSPRSRLLALALAGSFPFAACKKEEPPPPAPPAPAPKPPAPPAPPPPASASGQSQPDCVGPFTTTESPVDVKLGAFAAKRTGALLNVASAPEAAEHVFGLVANVKEATGENLFNLKRYVEFFKAQKAEAILVAGDSGESKEGITRVLEPLAQAGLPVFAIPGNREARADFRAAIEALAAKYPNLVDMTRVRLVNFPFASILSLPGYYDRRFIHVGEAGCQYFKEDVAALAPIAVQAKQPAILLAHAEPHGKGPDAIDAFPEGNAGDDNLTQFLKANRVPFGVFANIHEAGGRATDLDSNVVKEGEFKEKLFVNPGLADSTAWKLNDKTWSNGMVGTLTVKGTQAAYKVFRAAQLTEAEEAEARKLEPTAAAAP